MFRGVNKLLSILLALAVLLAPLEFAAAHDMGQMKADGKMSMQQFDDQNMDHAMDDGGDHECDGQCKHCVYCSPALGVSAELTLDKPDNEQPQTQLISHYSIDLPVESRPPRQL